jgi:hypothetical protein
MFQAAHGLKQADDHALPTLDPVSAKVEACRLLPDRKSTGWLDRNFVADRYQLAACLSISFFSVIIPPP